MPLSRSRTALSGWRGKIALASFSIGLTLALAEGAVRLFGWAPQLDRIALAALDTVYEPSDNPLLGYVLKRNYRGANPHPGFRRTNNLGFRDRDRTVESQTHRVIVLGDSVVAGHGVSTHHRTITARAEAYLGAGFEVLNFGVGGYCTRGEVALLEERGLGLGADTVVLLYVENDPDDLNSELRGIRRRIERPSWVEALFVHSELFRVVALSGDLWGLHTETTPSRVEPHMDAIGDNNVAGGLDRLKKMATTHGFDVRVVVWPHTTSRGFQYRDGPNGRPVQRLEVERLAEAHGFPVVRLGGFMQPYVGSGWADMTRDGMHPTDFGADVAGRALADVLRGP